MENRLSPPTSLRSAVSEWQDQEPVSGDPGPNNTHEGGERSDVGLSERDALREEVSTLKAQIADLTSKNAKMSSQMEDILARLNAEPSTSQGTHIELTGRNRPHVVSPFQRLVGRDGVCDTVIATIHDGHCR